MQASSLRSSTEQPLPLTVDHGAIAMARDRITLACPKCEERNYNRTKNKRLHPERVEYRKFCPRCRQHTLHKETK